MTKPGKLRNIELSGERHRGLKTRSGSGSSYWARLFARVATMGTIDITLRENILCP